MMLRRRLQVLADGEEVNLGGAHVVHHLENLITRLAQTDHETRFREQERIDLLDLGQELQRGEIARTRSNASIETGDRLEVVVVDVGSGRYHRPNRAFLAQ